MNESKSKIVIVDDDQEMRALLEDFLSNEGYDTHVFQLVLGKTAGRKDKAAQILGINRRTLYRKERDYGFVAADTPEEGLSNAELNGDEE